jgi:hypothetical protein
MSFKKTLRSIEAAQRRSERESRKRQRELERQQKEKEKMEDVERANYDVQVYENRIDVLTSIHKECGNDWNWEDILLSSAPIEPSKSNVHENEARDILNNYEPGLSDKFLRRGDKKRLEFQKAVELAIEEDNNEYANSIQEYEQELDYWNLTHDLAKRILSKDVDAYIEAIEQVGSFEEIMGLGSQIRFKVEECNLVEADLNVHSAEVIPSEVKSLLKSGKLSVKKMPKTTYFGLYQDYVCSCAIRVAREVFALLPTDMVIIHVISEILNSKTGNLEELPILSVAIPEETLQKLSLDMLDPSDSMDNFIHNMKFMKTKGFNPVERIDKSKFI